MEQGEGRGATSKIKYVNNKDEAKGSEDNKAKITDWTGEQTLTGKDKQEHIVKTRQRS